MEIAILVFMILIAVICLVTVIALIRDIIGEISDRKKAKRVEDCPMPNTLDSEPAAQEDQAEVAADIEQENDEDEEGKIVFSAGSQTLEEKYNELSDEFKSYYDEIARYAMAVEGNKCIKNGRYEEYKIGNMRIVRLVIKRGVIHCEFILPNNALRNYANENRIAVKQSATVIVVNDASTVEAVKNGIDIAKNAIDEEREYKKQLAKEKQRAKRMAHSK